MYLSRYFHTIDDKGRVAIPHKFRTELARTDENRVIITLSPQQEHQYLDVYPAQAWQTEILDPFMEQVRAGSISQEAREAFLVNYIHPAQEQILDNQGRILVPQEHREHAGLAKDVVFTGDVTKFRLWAVDGWKRFQESGEQKKDKISELKGIPL
jgi:MraZ protein